MDEEKILKQLNEGFKELGLVSLTDYAKAKGIKPPALYKNPHKKQLRVINGYKFYKL